MYVGTGSFKYQVKASLSDISGEPRSRPQEVGVAFVFTTGGSKADSIEKKEARHTNMLIFFSSIQYQHANHARRAAGYASATLHR